MFMNASAGPDDVAPSQALDLESFFQCVAAVNPFLDNRVNAPSAHDVDVKEIHQAEFERLTELARDSLLHRRGVGAVLWGEAGIGKSHLLSRLGRWAAEQEACFVYLHNLQAAPEYLPRSLLHSVLSILTRGRRQDFQATLLFELVRAGLVQAVHRDTGFHTWEQYEHAFHGLVDQIGGDDLPGATLIDHGVYQVLFQFFRSTCRRLQGREDGSVAERAVRWLAGQALDPHEARSLGLVPRRPDHPVALLDNQQIKQVLVALTRLAAAREAPFVLVFDQVDNLDREQMAALARFLEALIDSSPNLLVVTAGIQATLLQWQQEHVIQDSAWDRLAQFKIALHRLNARQADAIVGSRVQEFMKPFAELEPLRSRVSASFFPLGRGWRAQLFTDRIEFRPRDVINAARDGWRLQQERLQRQGGADWLADWPGEESGGGNGEPPTREEIEAATDRRVEEWMRAYIAELQREPERLPADGDHLAGLISALLLQCRDAGPPYNVLNVEHLPAPRRGARPTYDLALDHRGPDGTSRHTGILVLTARSATSVAGFLRRLLDDPRPLDRLVLVTDQRVGLPLGERGEEYLRDLQQAGPHRFRTVELTFAEHAQLQALAAIVKLAQSGDLEIEPWPGQAQPVSKDEVIASHHRCDRYLATPLLRELLAPTPEPMAAAP
jgi:hypothetical protein